MGSFCGRVDVPTLGLLAEPQQPYLLLHSDRICVEMRAPNGYLKQLSGSTNCGSSARPVEIFAFVTWELFLTDDGRAEYEAEFLPVRDAKL
jgi:hypothetical protein